MKHSLLIVDDEIDNVQALERLFRKKYQIYTATSGKEGLILFKDHPEISIILTDQRMPEMTGVDFLSQTISIQPETIRILLTGYTDIDSVIEAVNSGEIYRYLTKPWDPIDLINTINKAAEKFDLRRDLKKKNILLQKAFEELKSLDKNKTDFMMLINHELRTPLTGISSFLQILYETHLSEEQKIYTNRIEKNVQRLQKLVNDTLLIMSGETAKLKISKHKVAIKDLIQIKNETLSLMQKKNQHLESVNQKISVTIDKTWYEEIFSRLIENASKFGRENSPIVVSVYEENGFLTTSIQNEGPTLKEETIQTLLQPFAQQENAMNHSQGTGLGLTVCQALLKILGGQLTLTPETQGMRVVFSLPVAANA